MFRLKEWWPVLFGKAGSRMLAETEVPLLEVAEACGYAGQSAFTRQFKSAVGMNSGVFRK